MYCSQMKVAPTSSTAPMEIEQLQTLLADFKQKYANDYYLTALGYFGSYARGEAKLDSDIDIVFQTDRPNLLYTAILKQELEALLGHCIDIVRWRETMNPTLKVRIEREAQYV